MSKKSINGDADKTTENPDHEGYSADISEGTASFLEALFGAIGGLEGIGGGAFLSYHYTYQGIGLLLSGATFVAYALFLHYRYKVKHIQQFSYKSMSVAIIVNAIGFLPMLLFFKNGTPTYHITFNVVANIGTVLKEGVGMGLFGFPSTEPLFIVPMQAAISFTVDNTGQSNKQIKAVSVSSSKTRNGPWKALCPVSSEGLTLVLSENRRSSVLVDPSNFVNGNLLGKNLGPGQAVTSWVALECIGICPDSYFKIEIEDAAGERDTANSADSFGKGNRSLGLGSSWHTVGIGPDLGEFPDRTDPDCQPSK